MSLKKVIKFQTIKYFFCLFFFQFPVLVIGTIRLTGAVLSVGRTRRCTASFRFSDSPSNYFFPKINKFISHFFVQRSCILFRRRRASTKTIHISHPYLVDNISRATVLANQQKIKNTFVNYFVFTFLCWPTILLC